MVASLDMPVPVFTALPSSFPRDGSVEIEIVDAVPILRASAEVQSRIEFLLDQQRNGSIASSEEMELSQYADVDYFLSYVNRLIRNLVFTESSTRGRLEIESTES